MHLLTCFRKAALAWNATNQFPLQNSRLQSQHLSLEAPAWRERRGELAGLPTALSPSTVQTSEGSSTERVTALKAEQALRV